VARARRRRTASSTTVSASSRRPRSLSLLARLLSDAVRSRVKASGRAAARARCRRTASSDTVSASSRRPRSLCLMARLLSKAAALAHATGSSLRSASCRNNVARRSVSSAAGSRRIVVCCGSANTSGSRCSGSSTCCERFKSQPIARRAVAFSCSVRSHLPVHRRSPAASELRHALPPPRPKCRRAGRPSLLPIRAIARR